MRIKKGFKLRKIDDLFVVLPTANAAQEFHGMITLNDSGAFLWKLLQEGSAEDALVASLAEEYEISEELARADTEKFIQSIREQGLLNADE